MKLVRIKPPNHNYQWGFYRYTGQCCGSIGFRFPLTTLDLRFFYQRAGAKE